MLSLRGVLRLAADGIDVVEVLPVIVSGVIFGGRVRNEDLLEDRRDVGADRTTEILDEELEPSDCGDPERVYAFIESFEEKFAEVGAEFEEDCVGVEALLQLGVLRKVNFLAEEEFGRLEIEPKLHIEVIGRTDAVCCQELQLSGSQEHHVCRSYGVQASPLAED